MEHLHGAHQLTPDDFGPVLRQFPDFFFPGTFLALMQPDRRER